MRVALLVSLAAAIGVCSTVAKDHDPISVRASLDHHQRGTKQSSTAAPRAHPADRREDIQVQERHVHLVRPAGSSAWERRSMARPTRQITRSAAIQLTSSIGTGTAYASSGRFQLGLSLIKLTAHGHSSGTFKGREPIGATRSLHRQLAAECRKMLAHVHGPGVWKARPVSLAGLEPRYLVSRRRKPPG